jgi:glycosyltransferase involved in cell wall biosynthesis
VLSQIDRALSVAGHRSIVLAAEGSVTTGELIGVPRFRGSIMSGDWRRAHDFVRAVIGRFIADRRVDLVHMHGVDFQDYLPSPGVGVLATLHLPLTLYPDAGFGMQRPQTWLNTVSLYQHRNVPSRLKVVRLIENGVVPPAPASTRKEPFALAMGRICPEKGFHLALDAAKAAGIPLKLAGSVSDFPEHQAYFDRDIATRLDASREWIGPVSGKLKWQLLQSARCVLVPSLVPETASLVAREALAAGTPVIAFPLGALTDIIEHGRTGFLVNNAEEMTRALCRAGEIDPSACRSVAEKRYSAARMTAQYLELYQQLADANS